MTIFSTIAAISAVAVLAACSPLKPAEQAQQQESVAPTSPIALSSGWAAITPNGATVGGGYVTITNNSDALEKLLSIVSSRAAHVELHEMRMDGAMMTMGKIDSIEIPAHGTVEFQPSGNHLMFIGITAPFKAGETVPVTLTFEHAGASSFVLPVRERLNENASARMDMSGSPMKHEH